MDRVRAYENILAARSDRGTGTGREYLIREAAVALGYEETTREPYRPFEPTNRALKLVDPELEELMWDWVAAGLVTPQLKHSNSHGSYIDCVRVTKRGNRLLRAHAPSPLLSSFDEEIRSLPADVRARLEDAQQCLRARLLRPAVIMTGLSYETLVQELHDQARAAQVLSKKTTSHLDRLDVFRRKIGGLGQLKGKHDALAAVDHAIVVNQRRNDAAHATAAAFEYEEVHDLLGTAPFWLNRLKKTTVLLRFSPVA